MTYLCGAVLSTSCGDEGSKLSEASMTSCPSMVLTCQIHTMGALTWGLPEIMSTFLAAPIIRIVVYWVYVGVPFLGKLPHWNGARSGIIRGLLGVFIQWVRVRKARSQREVMPRHAPVQSAK